jgi:hypothetical protein
MYWMKISWQPKLGDPLVQEFGRIFIVSAHKKNGMLRNVIQNPVIANQFTDIPEK